MIRSALPRARWRTAAIATAVAAACTLQPAMRDIALPSAQAQEAVRAEVGRPLQQARDLIKANRHKEALARLREVDAVPNRTASENFLLEQMRASAASQAGDLDQAIKSITFLINSGRLNEAESARFAAGLAGLHYRQRDFKSAADWAERALKANPNDAAMRALLIQSHFQAGDLASAQREALADILAAEKAGRTPPEDQLQLLANIAARNTADRGAYISALERLVTHYPRREYWADLLRRIEGKPGWSNRLTIELYRLRAATRTLTSAADYSEYAQLALQDQQAGEAKRILDEGFAAGILGKGPEAERQQRLLALATQRAADAPRALAEAEKEAAADKDGNNLVRIGLGFSGLGQHDKAIALIQQGVARGGLRRKDDATLHFGIALHRAGQKQRAAQVLRTVGGTDGTADLARLWVKVP